MAVLIRSRNAATKSFNKNSWFSVPAYLNEVKSVHFRLFDKSSEQLWTVPYWRIKKDIRPVGGYYRVSIQKLETIFSNFRSVGTPGGTRTPTN